LVQEAGQLVLTVEQDRQRQADLLSVLGALAEPLIAADQFIKLFERERLMESKLFELLMQDKVEELKAAQAVELEQKLVAERAALEAEWTVERAALERAVLEAERVALEAARAQAVLEAERAQTARTLRDVLTRAVEEAITGRFPTAPLTLATRLRAIQDPQQLDELLRVALRAPDLEMIERAIAATAE
jgi:hypothetical protein